MALTEQRLADLVAVITRLLPILNDMPLLGVDEMGVELATGKVKIGDGSTPWASLPYLTSSGGSGALLSISRDFTVAELNALDVTSIEVLPAPGPGFAYVVLRAVIRAIGGAVSYDNGVLDFAYGSSAGQTVGTNTNANYPTNTDDSVTFGQPTNLNANAIGDIEDQSIIAFNSGTDPSTGDGTMSVSIYYVITAV